jgi:hypothetical protein
MNRGSDPDYRGHVPDDIFELAKRCFSDEELANLTLAVITINGWNRIAISFRSVPGSYQPGMNNTATSKVIKRILMFSILLT